MLRALVYLRLTSLRNWVRWQARRLRRPKYLLFSLVWAAYMYFFFFRHVTRAAMMPTGTMPGASVPAEWLQVAVAIGSIVLLVVLTLKWVLPADRAALGFSEAEIAFLFPAPVTRRALIHFRLISAQLRSLVGGIVMTLLSNRWTFLGGNAVTHLLGWWFIFSTLNLHFTGASFTLTRLSDRGGSLFIRRLSVLFLIGAIVTVTWRRLAPMAPELGANAVDELPRVRDWLIALTSTAPLCWLLLPLRWVLGPFVAADARAFLSALGPAMLVIGLHYLWVVQSAVSFEEASIARAAKRAARVAAWRSGQHSLRAPTRGRKPAFRLADTGWPQIAFLWKNLLSTPPYFTGRVFAWTAFAIAAVSVWVKSHPTWQWITPPIGFVAITLGVYLLILGPMYARQDIRGDLQRMDLLKTYPLHGWQIVLGELLAPTVILTGIIWLLLLACAMNLEPQGAFRWLTSPVRLASCTSVALLIPPLVMLQLLVPNAAALFFPSWAQAVRARGGGPEVFGQRLIYFFVQLLTIIVALLPGAAVAVAIVWGVSQFTTMTIAIAVATTPVLTLVAIEVALGVWWLGQQFEKIDVAEELRS
jgi:ABC-2 type transport system permease protein